MNRTDVIDIVVAAKLARKLTWKALAEACGRSEVWTTSRCWPAGHERRGGDSGRAAAWPRRRFGDAPAGSTVEGILDGEGNLKDPLIQIQKSSR